MHDWLLDALALFLPVECAGCGAPDRSVCTQCRSLLDPLPVTRRTPAGLTCVTALRYEGEVRRVLLALKEEGRTDVSRHLAPALFAAVRAATLAVPEGAQLLVIPTSRRAYRRRGFDPVRSLCSAARLRVRSDLTIRSSAVQKSLSIEQRAQNRSGTMHARRSLDGMRVVLIDDVLTTGATIDEAARAVGEAGGEVVASVALAFTPRLFGSSPSIR